MVSKKRREGADEARPKPAKPRLIRVDEVECKEVDWLWRPYVPRGMVTLLEGDPGLGKSWITMAIAKAVSTGTALPGQPALSPQKVLIGSAEDLPEYSIAPRLKALGADCSLIYLMPNIVELSLEGLQTVEDFMKECAATVLFIDPIQAYLGSKVDMHRANEVRPIMAGLGKLAERTHSAIIIVRHLRKGGDGSGKRLYAGLGSIDFAASVRSILQVEKVRSGDTVINHIKSNISGLGPAISYKVHPDSGFEWGGVYNDTESGGVCKVPRARNRAVDFIRQALGSGPVPAGVLMEMAKAEKLSIPTMNRAKDGVAESYQTAEGWFWRLLETT